MKNLFTFKGAVSGLVPAIADAIEAGVLEFERRREQEAEDKGTWDGEPKKPEKPGAYDLDTQENDEICEFLEDFSEGILPYVPHYLEEALS